MKTATYRFRMMREEASLFQPDVSLPNKVSIAVDKEQDFYDRPGRIPYV